MIFVAMGTRLNNYIDVTIHSLLPHFCHIGMLAEAPVQRDRVWILAPGAFAPPVQRAAGNRVTNTARVKG
jgi:hypothetical protein